LTHSQTCLHQTRHDYSLPYLWQCVSSALTILPACIFLYKNHGYKLYGKDASKIVEELIKDASDKDKFSSKIEKWGRLSYWLKRLLNMHRVTDARYVLNSIMEDAVREDRGFEGTLDEEYVFGPEGTSKTAQFHVWQVKDGEFAEAPP
jgi:hypothetical protein